MSIFTAKFSLCGSFNLRRLICFPQCCRSERTEHTADFAGAVISGGTVAVHNGDTHITQHVTADVPETALQAAVTQLAREQLAMEPPKVIIPPALKPMKRHLSDKKERFMAQMPTFLEEVLTNPAVPVKGELFQRRVRIFFDQIIRIEGRNSWFVTTEDELFLGNAGNFIDVYGLWDPETEDSIDVLHRYCEKMGGDNSRFREARVPRIMEYAHHLANEKVRLQRKRCYFGCIYV